jgi:uncharacterized integral membrane protein
MSTKMVPLVVPAIIAVLVVALAATNLTNVVFSLFGAALSIPEGTILAAGFFLGLLSMFPVVRARIVSEQASHKALTKWDAEDQKLATQVQSDREKQLEAKIATLEAALQKALKK